MRHFFIFFLSLFIYSCSSDKEKKVDLEVFKRQGEKINVFEDNNIFDKEVNSKSLLQLNLPFLNKNWAYEHYSSTNYYEHFTYEGKLQVLFKKAWAIILIKIMIMDHF